jgi:hypothetical protein
MSEHELFLIRQRMLSGKLAKAERGELAIPLPIGYVRRPSGEAVLDPDEQAQHVVRLVFSTFRRLGTLNGVLRYLVEQEVQLPVRVHSGPAKGELEWRRPTRETLQIMLHNPVYAGYYAYGRRQVEPRRKVPGRPSTGRVAKDAGEWLVLLPGKLPAYITPEEHEANIARMAANRQTAATPGAPRNGSALLSGLLRCGRCGGHRMTVRYHDGPGSGRATHSYTCSFFKTNYGTGDSCQHIAGPALDDWVASQVLDAVAPAALEVSMAAAAEAENERAMLDKLWRQRIDRARYEADRSSQARNLPSLPYASSAVTHAAGTPASRARPSIVRASSVLVANTASSGTAASRQRSRSAIHDFGRYSSRSIRARPLLVAYAQNTPSWQFSTRPAVPEYCRCTPADLVPFLRNPVSSTTSTPSAEPRCPAT